jgi:putative peptidoglycan lipid II flippase
MGPLGHVGVALATAISAWLNVALLALTLRRRSALTLDGRLLSRLPRIVLSTAGMAVMLWYLQPLLAGLASGGKTGQALALAALIGAGIAAYFALAQLSGAARLGEIKAMLRRSS